MRRCVITASLVVAAVSAHAQTQRFFPSQALRDERVVTQAPDVLVNGQLGSLSPGAQIRRDTSLLLMSGSISGQKNLAYYTLTEDGQVKDAGILNPAELAKKQWQKRTGQNAVAKTQWPPSLQESSTRAFEPGTRTWTRP